MSITEPTSVRSITVTPVNRGGRPKDEPRQAAIAMASLYAQRIAGSAAAGRRLLTAAKRDARFPFALSNDRNVRRVESDERNPINRLPLPCVPAYLDGERMAMIGAPTINVLADELRISGAGWVWTEGQQKAVYGDVVVVADLSPAHDHSINVSS